MFYIHLFIYDYTPCIHTCPYNKPNKIAKVQHCHSFSMIFSIISGGVTVSISTYERVFLYYLCIIFHHLHHG